MLYAYIFYLCGNTFNGTDILHVTSSFLANAGTVLTVCLHCYNVVNLTHLFLSYLNGVLEMWHLLKLFMIEGTIPKLKH